MKPPAAAEEASVFVSNLQLMARVGVNPGEQTAEQAITLDIWVGVEDMAQAARSRRLQDTLDYVEIARIARRVVQRGHTPLVETLATDIARELLLLPQAAWVRVRLRKLRMRKCKIMNTE